MSTRSSILPLSLSFLLAASSSGCASEDPGPVGNFEHLWAEMNAMYGPFEIRGVDWDDAYAQYRPLVHDEMSEDELYGVLTDMLGETDDGHVGMITPGRMQWSANQIRRDQVGYDRFDLDLVREGYLHGDFETNAWDEYTLGHLDDGSTYLHLPFVSDNLPVMGRARELADASGMLIIDLRHNNGGDFTYAFQELAEWTSTVHPVFRTRARNGSDRDDFDDWEQWSIEGRGEDVEFPIVVLIDRHTISAGERMVLGLATFDDVVFIGEPTNGAVSTVIGRELPNGWYVTISTQEVLSMDGTSIEGPGFVPDLEVINDEADMALGVDAALDAAMAALAP